MKSHFLRIAFVKKPAKAGVLVREHNQPITVMFIHEGVDPISNVFRWRKEQDMLNTLK